MIKFDMMHAADYSNMKMGQMTKNIDAAKKKHKQIAKAIKYVRVVS